MTSPPKKVKRKDPAASPGIPPCPVCGSAVPQAAFHCPTCKFTGADSIGLFSDTPPPLLPLLDVADLWNAQAVKQMTRARENLESRYPQIHWRFCAVDLPPETKLPVFGFWLLNMSPLVTPETEADRAWTVLLLVNRSNGYASVIPGYSVEPWLGRASWEIALQAMRPAWRDGNYGQAVAHFLAAAGKSLDIAWKKNRHLSKA